MKNRVYAHTGEGFWGQIVKIVKKKGRGGLELKKSMLIRASLRGIFFNHTGSEKKRTSFCFAKVIKFFKMPCFIFFIF